MDFKLIVQREDRDMLLKLLMDEGSFSNLSQVSKELRVITVVELLNMLGKLDKQEIIDLVVSIMSEEG